MARTSAFKKGVPVFNRSVQLPISAWNRAAELATIHRTSTAGVLVMGLRALDRLTPRGGDLVEPEATPEALPTEMHPIGGVRIVGIMRGTGPFARTALLLRTAGGVAPRFLRVTAYDDANVTGSPISPTDFEALFYDDAAIRLTARLLPHAWAWSVPTEFGPDRSPFLQSLVDANAIHARAGTTLVINETIGNPIRERWASKSATAARALMVESPTRAADLAERAMLMEHTAEHVALACTALERCGNTARAASLRSVARVEYGTAFDAKVAAVIAALR